MPSSFDRIPIFAYLTAEKAQLYRAAMHAFMQAKERYALHQRPHDVTAGLRDLGFVIELSESQNVLNQLVEWGNVERHPDTSDVRTVEEFYLSRYLYRMTDAGESAERAVVFYEENLRKPGELQTAALSDIGALLEELAQLMNAEPDGGKVIRVFQALFSRLEDLTQKAQSFLAGLQSAVDLRALPPAAFTAYKQRLVEYLERFLHELVLAQFAIGERIAHLESRDIAKWLELAAAREVIDRIEITEAERLIVQAQWKSHWEGLRRWFLSTHGERPQAEELRSHARAAIPAFLAAVLAINEQFVQRSDRAADFKTLARWFAQAPSDASAHQLWRAAFGLSPARHLMVDTATLDRWEAAGVTAQTSWLSAPPLEVSLRLRTTGRYTRPGRPNNTIDRSDGKRILEALSAKEFAQIEEAQRRLATGRRMRLSEMGMLEPSEFDLFLEILATALSAKINPDDTAETSSSDGALLIRLEPTKDGKSATLVTADGTFFGNHDHWITISDVNGLFAETSHVTA